ncbi:MAG: hypothetical protein LBL45_11165, partial [Treponema sp.]|nr:hypothetical protein [Treponema sp.]
MGIRFLRVATKIGESGKEITQARRPVKRGSAGGKAALVSLRQADGNPSGGGGGENPRGVAAIAQKRGGARP